MNDAKRGKTDAREKVVRRTLADGTVREYRYDLGLVARRRFVAARSDALNRLAGEYFASADFKRLAPNSQYLARHYLAIITDELGWMTFDDLASRRSRADFYRLRDDLAEHPVKADQTMGWLRILLGWAYDRGLIEVNHAVGLERLTPRRSRADRIWTPAQEAAFLAAADAGLALAWRLALYTAARQSDLLALRWSDLRDGWLSFTPIKTRRLGIRVELPVHDLPPLAQALDAAPRTGETILHPVATPGALYHRFTMAMNRAGLADSDLHWHDIRGTAASRMLEAGCSEAGIGAVMGHALGRGSLRSYAARTRDLARGAYRQLARAMARPVEIISLGKRARKTPENTG